jgi:hypothetical protein
MVFMNPWFVREGYFQSFIYFATQCASSAEFANGPTLILELRLPGTVESRCKSFVDATCSRSFVAVA